MDPSPLAKVPTEIRLVIFEYALSFPIPLRMIPATATRPRDPKHPTALLQTCRQIRRECKGLIYRLNTYIIPLSTIGYDVLDTTSVATLLHQIGPGNASHLSTLILEVHGAAAIRSNMAFRYIQPILDDLAKETALAQTCRLWLRPFLLSEYYRNVGHDFEAFLQAAQLDLRVDLRSALKSALGRLQTMKATRIEMEYEHCICTANLYAGHLSAEERRLDESSQAIRVESSDNGDAVGDE